jgi:hypothetical protein
MATGAEVYARGRAAVADVVPQLTALLRRHPAPAAPGIGSWTAGQTACHLSHVMRADTDALVRRVLPQAELSTSGVATMTATMLEADPERDLVTLADRLETLTADFLDATASPSTEPVPWVGDVLLPPSAVVCHLLEELLVHGYDIATAAGARWRIDPAHAALAITGAATPIISASPQSFVKAHRAAGFRARIVVSLRGHGRFALVFDDGLRVEEPPASGTRADAHLSIAPDRMLLLMLSRITPWRSLLTGKAVAWGRRPQVLPQMLTVLSPP